MWKWLTSSKKPDLDLSNEHVSDIVLQHNIKSTHFPLQNVHPGIKKIWDVWSTPIPVYDTPKNGDSRTSFAMDEIETRLGLKMFTRQPVTNLKASVDKGIVISYDTALGEPGQKKDTIKGHVSRHPDETEWPTYITDTSGRFDCLLYLSLDSKDAKATEITAIHEFGHALGIAGHFSGYGDPQHEISDLFWLVLRELYS